MASKIGSHGLNTYKCEQTLRNAEQQGKSHRITGPFVECSPADSDSGPGISPDYDAGPTRSTSARYVRNLARSSAA